MSDSFCWTPQRKILTPAQTGLRALPVFGIRFQIYETEGHLYSLCGNDVFVVRPGELHSSGDFPESVSRMIWFQLDVTGTEPFLGLDQPSSDELRPALLVLPRLFHANASLGADTIPVPPDWDGNFSSVVSTASCSFPAVPPSLRQTA